MGNHVCLLRFSHENFTRLLYINRCRLAYLSVIIVIVSREMNVGSVIRLAGSLHSAFGSLHRNLFTIMLIVG